MRLKSLGPEYTEAAIRQRLEQPPQLRTPTTPEEMCIRDSGNVDPSEDNMLKITNDGRKLALDQRLIDPLLPDEDVYKRQGDKRKAGCEPRPGRGDVGRLDVRLADTGRGPVQL